MKRLSQGELDECRKQVAFLLDQGWIVPSSSSHAASVVFARKPDGSWRFCQDFRGLNAITQRSVEPLPHVGQLVDETRGARFFTKLDLAMGHGLHAVPDPRGGPVQDVVQSSRLSVRVLRRRFRSAS
jgi:hypothetical protein